jgi:hypothetical protein
VRGWGVTLCAMSMWLVGELNHGGGGGGVASTGHL